MNDTNVEGNGEVRSASLFGFADKVHRDWIKSDNPEKVITCNQLEDALIFVNNDLYSTVADHNVRFNWKFKILTYGKPLQQVILTLDQNRSNFILESVFKCDNEIGTINGHEWYKTEKETINSKETIKSKQTSCIKAEYIVKISFATDKYGTYRQNVIFSFGEYSAVLRRLCIDCVPSKDFPRINKAMEYQLSRNPKMWIDKTMPIWQFSSPFVPPKNPKEEKLSLIYPYPDKCNFILTQETLTDDRLTPENYRGRLHELISVEELARHEQIARYNVITHMRLLSHYILTSTGDASTIAKYASFGELFGQLPVSRSITEDTKSGRLFLRSCDSAFIKCLTPNADTNIVHEVHIEDKCMQTVYIRLSSECVNMLELEAETDLEVQVQFVLNRIPFCNWHRAVDSLPNIELVFLNNVHQEMNEADIQSLIDPSGKAFTEDWEWRILNPSLNKEQKRALLTMTAPIQILLPPVLLLGPFGTGKTFTIAQALRLLLVQSPEHKILLCTHSNSAADLYIKEFFDTWYKAENSPRLKPVRIYYTGRARKTVHPVVQEYSLMNENGTFRNPTEEDLRDCGLIVTTLATASSLTSLNVSFTHIVIDEAAQALECEILIPLSLATQETRLVLGGDQNQLAPEIYSDLANECGLGISLLERIYKMYPRNHPCTIHLSQNYRAHADIIKFTSEVFYKKKVIPGKNQLRSHPVYKPLTFYAVYGEEIQGAYSTGYAHAAEAFELADRVLELRSTWPVKLWGPYGEGSIGVLSYYAEQVQRIRTELRNRNLVDVCVERVLNVQGKQFTAVFISTVRTRTCCRYSAEKNVKDFGFLTNPRLLNTAITRAKCLVAVVGDPLALLTIGSCRKLWQKYLELADLHGTDRETLEHHVSLVPELPLSTPLNPLAQEFVPRNVQPACLLEYVPVPIMYPFIRCSTDCSTLR